MATSGENKTYNISANNFTIEESKILSMTNKNIIISNSNCIFETEDI